MRVLKNPLFLIACILFWANQYLEKVQGIFIPFVHAYMDDLLAMPVVLGITLQAFQWIHPLRAGFRFTKVQVLVGWLYFSLLFEILLPRWSDHYVADPWDVLAYGIGAAFFYRFINK
jgi:hypothetical protein